MLRDNLRDQLAEKDARKQFSKEMNNDFAQGFREKIRRDEEKERLLKENIDKKSKECQEFVLRQIEEKKAKGKGMSREEFDFNKELLKEIVTKKDELRSTIMKTQDFINEKKSMKALPAYEIYEL